MDLAGSAARTYNGGSNGVGSILQGNVPESTSSRIHAALEIADNRVAELHNIISELEKRLSYILAPNSPTPSGTDKAGVSPINSPVTDRLGSINSRLAGSALYLQSILGRLEL